MEYFISEFDPQRQGKSELHLHISPSLNPKTIHVNYLSMPLPHNTDSQHVTTGFQRRPILQT